jgi:cell division protein FtsQ
VNVSTTTTAPSETPIDPRMRARRIAVRREEGRRRLRRLTLLSIAAGVLLAAWGVTRTPLLDVDRIAVRGNGHTAGAAVVAASGVRRGVAMTDVDLRGAEHRLAALPWVLSATVTRQWPGTVSVVVHERRPAAVVPATAGRWALVDREARVLALVPRSPGGLVALRGLKPPGSPGTILPPTAGDLLLVSRSLPRPVAPRVAAVARVGEGDLRLLLRPGGTVLLGTTAQLDDKLLAVATLLADVDTTGLDVLDVRVPAAPSLTRRR